MRVSTLSALPVMVSLKPFFNLSLALTSPCWYGPPELPIISTDTVYPLSGMTQFRGTATDAGDF